MIYTLSTKSWGINGEPVFVNGGMHRDLSDAAVETPII